MGETGTAALELDEHSGDVILRFGGNEYRAHPPTLGQMRQLEQYAEQTDRAEQERQAAIDTAAETDGPVVTAGGILSDNAEQLVGWWHLLFELTGEPKLPVADACPMWLGSLSLISQTLVHFMLFPIRGLGSSSPNPGPTPAV